MKKITVLLITWLLLMVNAYAAEITVTGDNGDGKVTCTNVSEGLVNVRVSANIIGDGKPVYGKNITVTVYGTRKPFDSALEKQINGTTYYLCFIDHVKMDSDGNVDFNFNINVDAESESDYYFSFGGNDIENLLVITKSLPAADPQKVEPMDPPAESGGSDFASTVPNISAGGGSGGGGGGSAVPESNKNEAKPDETASDAALEEIPEKLKEDENSTNKFADINASHWAYDACLRLCEAGIVDGDGDSRLRPDDNISREEIAAVLSRAFGLTADNAEAFEIDDMSSDWAKRYLAAVVQNDIMRGYSENVYKGTAMATRAETVTMICRITGETEGTSLAGNFSDVQDIPDYSLNAFASLIDKGIINGYSDNTLRPDNYISRAELFKIISLIVGG